MYPIIESTIKECSLLHNSPDLTTKIKLFMEQYFENMIANTQIYVSHKLGVAFPYTVIRLSEIAYAIHQNIGIPVNNTFSQNHSISNCLDSTKLLQYRNRPQKEFIFGTFFSIRSGHPYHWSEHGIDQIAKRIQTALYALMRSETPRDFEVYGIGSPVGELGSLSDDFVMQAQIHPYEYVGKLYAEFIVSLKQNGSEKLPPPILKLWGVSMGASVAASTAQMLIETKEATQYFNDTALEQLPIVRVNMHVPVGASKCALRKWQIPIGLGIDIIHHALTNKYGRNVGLAEREFIAMIHKKLHDRGIYPSVSQDAVRAKRRLIYNLIRELREGVPMPKWLKTTEVIGICDPLMYSWEFQKQAVYRRHLMPGSLGANIVPSDEQSRRRFAIMMTHNPAVVRRNYFKRLISVAQLIQTLSLRNI